MEFDLPTTAAVFVALNAIGIAALLAAPVPMQTTTILTMVLPSMVVFGLICLVLGLKFGQHRSGAV